MTTLGIGAGALIAGLLGMNLKNFMEDWALGFPIVSSLAFGTSLLVCGYGLTRLKRIQKLTLYGRYPGSKANGNGLLPSDAEYLDRLKGWRRNWAVGQDGTEFGDEVSNTKTKWWKRIMKKNLRQRHC